jgi:hypothetical protein
LTLGLKQILATGLCEREQDLQFSFRERSFFTGCLDFDEAKAFG